MLAHLVGRRFRNLAPLAWSPAAGGHLLLGGNGAGKTSILEAIYLLATTRSFRTAQVADCCRHGADGFELLAEVEGQARTRLEVSWVSSGAGSRSGGGRRQRRVNGNATTLAEHLAVLPVVAWTGEQVELLTGPPAVRRRFLDRGVIGVRPAALEALTRYRKILGHKRQVLADGGRELATWNQLLAGAAAEVIALRGRYVELLAAALEQVLKEAALDFPAIRLRYRPSPRQSWVDGQSASAGVSSTAGPDGEAAVAAALERAADQERRRRMPLVGPHRDELVIAWADHQLRRVASAGERKALGLCLLAAHGRVLGSHGPEPVYLLDDADTELAPATLESVWQVFAAAGQLFATSNRPDVWSSIPFAARWRVAGGEVSESS
ncbi:MAG: DNA replication and repair protein RecF [Acidobacteriota bacterium]|nr:DNA replication and repair protein RecF [Acidobacteriota bacterium]